LRGRRCASRRRKLRLPGAWIRWTAQEWINFAAPRVDQFACPLAPARAVEDQQNRGLGPGARVLGELRQREAEPRGRDRGQHQIELFACDRSDESIDAQPLVARVLASHRADTLARPHPPLDGLQAQAALVLRPDRQVHRPRPMGDGPYGSSEPPFLKASRASGSDFSWAGRGRLRLYPRRFM
jgi:hypothetical protein